MSRATMKSDFHSDSTSRPHRRDPGEHERQRHRDPAHVDAEERPPVAGAEADVDLLRVLRELLRGQQRVAPHLVDFEEGRAALLAGARRGVRLHDERHHVGDVLLLVARVVFVGHRGRLLGRRGRTRHVRGGLHARGLLVGALVGRAATGDGHLERQAADRERATRRDRRVGDALAVHGDAGLASEVEHGGSCRPLRRSRRRGARRPRGSSTRSMADAPLPSVTDGSVYSFRLTRVRPRQTSRTSGFMIFVSAGRGPDPIPCSVGWFPIAVGHRGGRGPGGSTPRLGACSSGFVKAAQKASRTLMETGRAGGPTPIAGPGSLRSVKGS